jgi:hypothetical protein
MYYTVYIKYGRDLRKAHLGVLPAAGESVIAMIAQ